MSAPPEKPAALSTPRPPVNGGNGSAPPAAKLLDELEAFICRYVAYPNEHAPTAHALWLAHCWAIEAWENTPRIAFLSPEPGSGKSRALEVSELFVPRPVHAVNVSPAYLFRKVSDPAGTPTVLFDEIDTIFGPRAKDNEDLRGLLNAGHRRGAVAGRAVMRGANVETEELPAYCAVALAGLNDLPDTLASRSIIVRMRRRAPGETVESFRHRVVKPKAEPLANQLAAWVESQQPRLREAWPDIPPEVTDRPADCWEPLLAVADAAGGEWPTRAREAAVALVRDAQENTRESLGVKLLLDLRAVFTTAGNPEHLPTEVVLTGLHGIEESPWADLRGQPLNPRGLSQRLRNYGIRPVDIRTPEGTRKGYRRADLADPWHRYLPEPVADVADVADLPELPLAAANGTGPCNNCGNPTHRYGDGGNPLCGDCQPSNGSQPRAAVY